MSSARRAGLQVRLLLCAAFVCAAVVAAAALPSDAQQPPSDGRTPDPAITDGSARRAYDAARARWAARGATSYRFRVARSCFCPPQYTRARTITVRRGRPVRPPEAVSDVATVPRLFRVVRRAIEDGAARLDVVYDRRRGFPVAIAVDGRAMVADDEVGYAVDRFRAG